MYRARIIDRTELRDYPDRALGAAMGFVERHTRLGAEIGRFVRANFSSLLASGLEYVLITALVLVRVHYLTAAAAGALTGALTDFSERRFELWPNIDRKYYKVHQVSGTSAEVTEGSRGKSPLDWVYARYSSSGENVKS